MSHCVRCNSLFHDENNDQRYLTTDFGPEIVSIIEQRMGHEIGVDDVLCETCFHSVLQDLQNTPSTSHIDQLYEGTAPTHDSYVCVWCRSSLFRRRTHSLSEGPERNEILSRIYPRDIPYGSLVCYSCWVRVTRIIQRQGSADSTTSRPTRTIQSTGNINVCIWCQAVLDNRRSHTLLEGPERNLVASRIYPREIPSSGRVCYTCWINSQRSVSRLAAIELENQENVDPELPQQSLDRSYCIWCRSSLIRRRTHILTGPERTEIAAKIYPREIPNHALACDDCWSRAQHNINLVDLVHEEPSLRIHLDEFSHTPESSRCFVPGCLRPERLSVPEPSKKRILSTKKLFVTESARVCTEHQTLYNWDILDGHEFNKSFTKDLIEAMLKLSLNEENDIKLNFENMESMSESVFKYWTGVSKVQFLTILNEIPLLSESTKYSKSALGLYLLKSRTGDSHERIASLVQKSKASVYRLLGKARDALKAQFVPKHVGINHLNRNELIRRNLRIPEGLFGNSQNRKSIIICDGTYVYLQKSSNYYFQKKTYSLHKYRNLVKPFLLVATDGHILDVFGPYPATTSDSDIMRSLFQNENGELRNYFMCNDIFILDRGFRDSVPFLESLGYAVHKPESLDQGETQLSTTKANKSRCVTLCRWVVEVVNGRFKRDYKLFRNEFFNIASTHLMDDFRICAAMINAFHPEIVDRPDAELILSRALERLNMPNYLADHIIQNNINRRRAHFVNIDEEQPELNIFPQMTMSDLVLFSLGIYQIKQARSYFGEHKRQHGSFVVEISNQLVVTNIPGLSSSNDTLLVRGRIRSRHHNNKIYYTYILLRPGRNWEEIIAAYYCSCICGKRTVGCCAHVMTMVWYFGWARHQDNIEVPATFLDGILIRDDVENEIE